ncbi:MAG: DUF559 domain-containing protein, partial [Acidimicrobiia bacterium]|nr:DUF559 domain-containing protein [Acidimicrobiia bacterium]
GRDGRGLASLPGVPHPGGVPRFPRRSYSTSLSRALRHRLTESERRLWVCLRSDFDQKFRRQEPLGPYICDFVCYSRRLVVEVDGSQHTDDPRDVERDRYLRRLGFPVVRVFSWDVMAHLDQVLEEIGAAIDDRAPIHRRSTEKS